VFKTQDIWPLSNITFMGFSVGLPANVDNVLMTMYGPKSKDLCKTSDLDHRTETYLDEKIVIECRLLKILYDIRKRSRLECS